MMGDAMDMKKYYIDTIIAYMEAASYEDVLVIYDFVETWLRHK